MPTEREVVTALARFADEIEGALTLIRSERREAHMQQIDEAEGLIDEVGDVVSQRRNGDVFTDPLDAETCAEFAARAVSIAEDCELNIRMKIGDAAADLEKWVLSRQCDTTTDRLRFRES